MSLMYECDMGEEVDVTSSPEQVLEDQAEHFNKTFKGLEALARCLVCRKCGKLPKEKVWMLGCCLTKYCETCVDELSGQRCLSCKKSGYPKDARPDLFSSSILSEIPNVYMTIMNELNCESKKKAEETTEQHNDEELDMDINVNQDQDENDKEEVVNKEIQDQKIRDEFEFHDDVDMEILEMAVQGTPKDQIMVSQDFPEVLEETPQNKVLGRLRVSGRKSEKRAAAVRALKLPSQEPPTETKDKNEIKMKTPSPEKDGQFDGDEELFQISPSLFQDSVGKGRISPFELPVLTPYEKTNNKKQTQGVDSKLLKGKDTEERRGKREIKKSARSSDDVKPPSLTPHKKDLTEPTTVTDNVVNKETTKRSTRSRKSSVSSTADDFKKSTPRGRGRNILQQMDVDAEPLVCKEKSLEQTAKVLDGDIPNTKTKSVDRKRRVSVGSNSSTSSGRASAINTTIPGSSTPASKEKRNAKGETALHIACRAGLLDKVTTLVESGADVNARDNCGWTPMHELIVGKGAPQNKTVILRILHEKGGDVNAFGGDDDETPLHSAVTMGSDSLVDVLLEFGASPNIRNKRSELPRDIAYNEVILNMLEEKMGMVVVSSPQAGVSLNNSTLSDDPALMQAMLKKAVIYFNCDVDRNVVVATKEKLKLKVSNALTSNVTHVIHKFTDTEEKSSSCVRLSIEYLYAISRCLWQVNIDWITDSLKKGRCVVPCPYEIRGYLENERNDAENCEEMVAVLSRINGENGNPGLLNGFCFYLYKTCGFTSGKLQLTKKNLNDLIGAAGGRVTNREPNPDAIDPLEAPPRFHVLHNARGSDDSSHYDIENLTLTTHIILYEDQSAPPVTKRYNMEHVKSLKSTWLIDSLAQFRLQDPNKYL